MSPRRPLAVLAAAAILAAGCNVATTGTGAPIKKTNGGAVSTTGPGTKPAKAYFGRVLGVDGKPAEGVTVRAYVIANNGSGLLTDNGAGLITDNGSGVVANNSSGVIANNGSGVVANNTAGFKAKGYGLTQAGDALQAKTDERGEFTLALPAGQKANVEAVLSDDVKAIVGGVTAERTGLELRLAPTGTLKGKVTAPADRKISDFLGVDVFIPGTSYVAKADKDGNYAIANVPVGTYKLYASKPGVGTGLSAATKVASKATADVAAIQLTLEPLRITAVEPASGPEGTVVTIAGEHFGQAAGTPFEVRLGGVVMDGAKRESDGKITFTLPASATSGDVVVSVGGLPSNGLAFQAVKGFGIALPRAGVPAGGSVKLVVTAEDAAGAPIAGPAVTWAVTKGEDLLTIAADGTATAKGAGQATVRATWGALVAEGPLQVGKAPLAAGGLGGKASALLTTLEGLGFGPKGWVLATSVGVMAMAAADADPTLLAGAKGDAVLDPDASATDGTGEAAIFNLIETLAVAPDGTAYLVDDGRVRGVDAKGEVATLAGGPNSNFQVRDGVGANALIGNAGNLTFAGGKLWFTDDPAIRTFDPATTEVKSVLRDTDVGSFEGLAAAPDGTIYVLLGGELKRLDGTKLVAPTAPKPAAYGLLLTPAEPEAAGGEEEALMAEAEEPPFADDPFPPAHLAIADGRFFTTRGARVLEIVGGALKAIAGGEAGEAPKDGPGADARFSELINGLVTGPDGALYVLDDNAVRRIDLKAPGYAVTTIVRGGSDAVVVRAKRPATK